MKSYVTFNEYGFLTGSFLQEVLPEHSQCHIEVSAEVRANWLCYRLNDARTDVVLLNAPAPLPSITDYRNAIEVCMNEKAKERGYDDIKSAALRAGYPGPFHDEGVKFAQWMDACWAKSYQVLDDVKAGKISQPSIADLLSQMPELAL